VEWMAGASTGVSGAHVEGNYLAPDEEKKHLEAVKLALERGADVNATGPGGRTALHGAAYWGATEMIQYLVEKGADLEAQDMYGQSAITIALGDPGHLIYRQLPGDDFDFRFRGPKSHKKAADLLVKLGAKPYTGLVADRSGQ